MKNEQKIAQDTFNFDTAQQQDGEYVEGRDELNFAEFPLASISNARKDHDKVIEFEDTIYDDASKQVIPRKLTISASAQHGLPTALDDEVILGLIQISKLDGFRNKQVYFSRYQLIKILGWRDHSESYKRIEEALDRWAGLYLIYEKAWRDKAKNAWVDAKFHILENVFIHRPDDPNSPDRCSFIWNEVVFRNFAAGSLKRLDFHRYRSLNSAIAKRIYRFLDKKFYLRSKWKFDLHEFAYTKVGISKGAQTAQIKQRLSKAIEELEECGFLVPMKRSERYEKLSAGKWLIHFRKGEGSARQEELAIDAAEESDIEQRLIKHGVTRKVAREFSAKYPDNYLRDKLDAFDYMLIKDEEAIKNPGAWLAKSIRDDFAPPDGFKTREEQEKERQAVEAQKRKQDEKAKARKEAEQAKERAKEETARLHKQLVAEFLAKLPPEENKTLQAEAEEAANRNYVGKKSDKESPFWKAAVSLEIEKAVLRRKPDLFCILEPGE